MEMTMFRLLASVCLALSALAPAQQSPVQVTPPGTVIQGEPGRLEGTEVLVKDIMARPEPQMVMRKRFKKEPPSETWPVLPAWVSPRQGPEQVVQTVGEQTQALFSIGLTFKGSVDNNQSIPPDTCGAVGPSQIIVATNDRIQLYNKSGVLQSGVLDTTLEGFFSSVGSGVFDPRVKYDRLAQRWYIVAVDGAFAASASILIAVSSGPTITNSTSFTFYSINASSVNPGQWFDYPILGMDEDGVYITTNNFTTGGDFAGVNIYSIRKSTLPGTLNYVRFANSGIGSSLAPADSDQTGTSTAHLANQGWTSGSDRFFRFYRINNPGSGSETFTVGNFVQVNSYSTSSMGNVVPQAGSPIGLAGNDTRLGSGAFMRRNPITGTWTYLTSHHFGPVALRSRFYEFDNMGASTPTLRQQGNLGSGSGRNYWFPSVAMNGQGHVVMASSASDSGIFASVNVAARLVGDTLGAFSYNNVAYAGLAKYVKDFGGGQNRWGDYSETCIDPNDNQTFWAFQTYAESPVAGWDRWGVRVVKVLAPPPATISSLSPASITQGQTISITVTGTSTGGSGFYDPGPGFANRIAAAFSGSGLTVNSVTFVSPTSLTLSVTASAGAATGARNLTVTNPDGQSTTLNNAITVNAGSSSPTVSSLTPNNADALTPGLTIRINGANFTNTMVGQWNNADRPTAFVSSTALDMTVSAADLFASGIAQVRVNNGGTFTSALNFTINPVNFDWTPLAASPLPGTAMRGPLSNLSAGDGVVVNFESTNRRSRVYDVGGEFLLRSTAPFPPEASLRVDMASSLPNVGTSTFRVSALNRTNGKWDTLATATGTSSISVLTATISNYTNYRRPDGTIRLRVQAIGTGTPSPGQWLEIDLVRVRERF
jgi:hypothetical protein